MTSSTFKEESATRYLHGQKGMKGHTFPRATVLTAGNDTRLDKIMLLPLHEAMEQAQRHDRKKEVMECNVFELMGMFYGILERLIIFTPCSKHGDSLSVCSVTSVLFLPLLFFNFLDVRSI